MLGLGRARLRLGDAVEELAQALAPFELVRLQLGQPLRASDARLGLGRAALDVLKALRGALECLSSALLAFKQT